MRTSFCSRIVAVLCGLFVPEITGFAQGTAFTYQGRLSDGNSPANGNYDLTFSVWTNATGPAQVGGTITNSATGVSNGLFTVTLDFGSGPFDGDDRWLEVGVRSNGIGAFITLAPRQQILPTPYSIRSAVAGSYAGPVATAQLTGTIASSNIGNGTITGAMLVNGAVSSTQLAPGAVTTANLADGAVTSPKLLTVTDEGKYVVATTYSNPAPTTNGYFGFGVAGFGADKVLVSSLGGATRLFSTNGAQLSVFTNPTPALDDFFGFAVAAVGADKVLIGNPHDNTGATASGSAYLFSTNGTLLLSFTNPTPAAGEIFSTSVASVGANGLLIGAPSDNTGASSAGSAYLFNTAGDLLLTFTNPAPAAGDFFGYAVAAVGTDKVVIGAVYDDSIGAAYLFSTNGTLLLAFTNPTPELYDRFGNAVCAVGVDKVLVGAPGDSTAGNFAGSAYLFSTNGALLATFVNPLPYPSSDSFGCAVASVGSDKVVIGAMGSDAGGAASGAALVFNINGTLLATIANPGPAAGDQFGIFVASVGDRVLAGAPYDDADAENAGIAYLFRPGEYTPGVVSESVRSGGVSTASLADGAVNQGKLDSTLFADLARLSANQTFNSQNAFINSGNSFTGDGSGLANLDAGHLTAGTVSDARLSNNISRLNVNQTFSGANSFTNTGNNFAGAFTGSFTGSFTGGFTGSFTGNGGALTNLNASILATGTVPGARLAGSYPNALTLTNPANSFNGSFTGNGAGLTNLDASDLATGTVADARLSNNLARLNVSQTFSGANSFTSAGNNFTGSFTGNGGTLTNLLASSLSSGIVPSGRLSGFYGNLLFFTNSLNLIAGDGSGITALNASSLASGTVPDVRLSSNFPRLNANQTFAGVNALTNNANTVAGNGAGLTGLNASNLSAGTVDDTRLSTNAALLTRADQTFTGLNKFTNAVAIGTTTVGSDTFRARAGGNDLYFRVFVGGAGVTDQNFLNTVYFSNDGTNASVVYNRNGGHLLLSPLNGNVGIGITPTNKLHVAGGVSATAFVTTSDRNAKENFTPVSPREILSKVLALPITEWNFKDLRDGRHLGPTAQDFHAAFGLGSGDTTITTVDPDGVALAAIQGLNQKLAEELKQKQTEIEELQHRLAKLENLLREKLGGASE